jgi:ketosteroid isomerase-like protein
MEDQRVWAFEESLWTASAEHYQESIDQDCLMVVPAPPYVLGGQQAIEAVKDTPRWSKVAFSEQKVSRPQEGLIVIAYKAEAEKDGAAPYTAHCTSVYRRLGHDDWKVVQHQQTPPLTSRD